MSKKNDDDINDEESHDLNGIDDKDSCSNKKSEDGIILLFIINH